MGGKWHVLGRQEVVSQLDSHEEKGLEGKEAAKRLKHLGPNQLVSAPKEPPWVMFLNQFKDFMVLVLLAATIISGFL